MPKPRSVAILLFDEVEVLDFAGPFEVFTAADLGEVFTVYTVAEETTPVHARGGLKVVPDYVLEGAPRPDVLVVPGGRGAREASAALVGWVRDRAAETEVVLSVCTGALLLAEAGLLDGFAATTHHSAFDLLRERASGATVVENRRFVDNGQIVTAAGVSAGVDAALHVVERLVGPERAKAAARYMEYTFSLTEK